MKYLFLTLIIFVSLFELSSQNMLELNISEGDIFQTEYKLESASFQEVNDEQQIVKKEISYSLLFNVLPSISDSSFYIKTTYKRIKHVYDIQGKVSVLDSDSIFNNNISEQDSFLLNVEKGFNFEITKKGEIISVDSISLQDFDILSNSLIQKVKDKSVLNYIFPKFSKKQLQKNESWDNSDTLKGEILNIHNKRFTFLESLDDTYRINELADISSNEEKTNEVKGYFVFYKLKGKCKGINTLYKNTCMIKDAHITESSFGTAEIKYSKDGAPIYSWPMKIENVILVKTLKIKIYED